VAAQPADHGVRDLVRRAQREADEVELRRRDGADGGAVRVVVPGREQLGGVDRDRRLALQRAAVDGAQLLSRRLEHEHGLAQHRQVSRAVGVLVRRPDHRLLGACRDAADQERRDVDALPDGEVVAHDDGDLRGEVGDGHDREECLTARGTPGLAS
jgi:hypothetical protein